MEEKIQLDTFINEINTIFDQQLTKDNVMDFLWSIRNDEFSYFNYSYIDTYETHTFEKPHNVLKDGDDYEIFYIYERKSDGKFFSIWTYNGKILEDFLKETNKIITTFTRWT